MSLQFRVLGGDRSNGPCKEKRNILAHCDKRSPSESFAEGKTHWILVFGRFPSSSIGAFSA